MTPPLFYCVNTNVHSHKKHKSTVCTHINTYKEPIVCIDAQRQTRTDVNLGKIRSRRSTVGWQHVLATRTLNGPCFLLIYKTFLSCLFLTILFRHYLYGSWFLRTAKPRPHAAEGHLILSSDMREGLRPESGTVQTLSTGLWFFKILKQRATLYK